MQLETMLDSILNETEIIHGRRLKLFKDADSIAVRVREIGQILTRTHQGTPPDCDRLNAGSIHLYSRLGTCHKTSLRR